MNVSENNALLPLVSCLSLYQAMGTIDAHNFLADISFMRQVSARFVPEQVERAFFMTYLQRSALIPALESQCASPIIPIMILAVPDSCENINEYYDHLFCATYGFGRLGAPDASWGLYALMQFFDSCFRHIPDQSLSSPVVSGMLLRTIEKSFDRATIVSWLEESLPWYKLHDPQRTHVFLLFSFAKIGAISLDDVERKLELLGHKAFSEFGEYTIPGFLADAPPQYRDFILMISGRYKIFTNIIDGITSLSDLSDLERDDVLSCLNSKRFVFASLLDLMVEWYNNTEQIRQLANLTKAPQVRNMIDAIIHTCSHPEGARVVKNFMIYRSGFSKIIEQLASYLRDEASARLQIEKILEALRLATQLWQEAVPPERIFEKDIEKISHGLRMLGKQIRGYEFVKLKKRIKERLGAAMPFIESRRKIAEIIAQKAIDLSSQLRDIDSIEPAATMIVNLVMHEMDSPPQVCDLRYSR